MTAPPSTRSTAGLRGRPGAGAGPSDLAALAAEHGLRVVGGRPPLGSYLRQVWGCRWFAWELAVSRVRANTSEDRLGWLWNFLQPLLLALVYIFVFGRLVGIGGTIPNYAAYVAIGVFTFHYMQSTVRNAAASIAKSAGLVRSLQFPRAVLPIVAALEELLQLLPAVLVMILVVLVTGAPPDWHWLALPLIFGLQTVFNVGLGLICARVAVHSHDFLQALPFITRLWFYLSGVLWSVDRVAGYPVLLFVFEVNPGFVYIHLLRDALLPTVPEVQYASWPLAIGWAVLAIVVGTIFFWRAEDRYGRG